jgi:hypothetical protein
MYPLEGNVDGHRSACCSLRVNPCLSLSVIRLGAQNVVSPSSFIIDPNRPYVYLKFGHIGSGIPRDESEPKTRIWLRVMKNCKMAIVVRENGTPDGSPTDERQIMYEVAPTVEPMRIDAVVPTRNRKRTKSEETPSADLKKMPQGYMGEVGSTESIPPGEGILFSIPVNHLSERWHIEIPYDFDSPQGKCCRDPNVGGQPHMVDDYELWDLPPEARAKIHTK